MLEVYNNIKALHLIFVITWFAGLFYLPRLFIYIIEAKSKPEEAQKHLIPQLLLMTRRLLNIITWPSAVLATIFAVVLLIINPPLLALPWMHIKLVFVLLLWGYHLKINRIAKAFYKGEVNYSSGYMRIFNEVATLILFAVIFIVILKGTFNWIYGFLGLILLSVLLMIGIKTYKRFRDQHPNK